MALRCSDLLLQLGELSRQASASGARRFVPLVGRGWSWLSARIGPLGSRRTAGTGTRHNGGHDERHVNTEHSGASKRRWRKYRRRKGTASTLASRDAQAKVVAEAELSAKTCAFEREPWFIKARIREAAIDLWLRPNATWKGRSLS